MIKTIAFIGNPESGLELAGKISGGEYRFLLFKKEHEKVHTLVEEFLSTGTGPEVEVIGCRHLASWEADIIILDLPAEELEEVAGKIREVSTLKPVILSHSHSDVTVSALHKFLPYSKIVNLEKRPDKTLIYGEDPDARRQTFDLMQKAGMDPVIVHNDVSSPTGSRRGEIRFSWGVSPFKGDNGG